MLGGGWLHPTPPKLWTTPTPTHPHLGWWILRWMTVYLKVDPSTLEGVGFRALVTEKAHRNRFSWSFFNQFYTFFHFFRAFGVFFCFFQFSEKLLLFPLFFTFFGQHKKVTCTAHSCILAVVVYFLDVEPSPDSFGSAIFVTERSSNWKTLGETVIINKSKSQPRAVMIVMFNMFSRSLQAKWIFCTTACTQVLTIYFSSWCPTTTPHPPTTATHPTPTPKAIFSRPLTREKIAVLHAPYQKRRFLVSDTWFQKRQKNRLFFARRDGGLEAKNRLFLHPPKTNVPPKILYLPHTFRMGWSTPRTNFSGRDLLCSSVKQLLRYRVRPSTVPTPVHHPSYEWFLISDGNYYW